MPLHSGGRENQPVLPLTLKLASLTSRSSALFREDLSRIRTKRMAFYFVKRRKSMAIDTICLNAATSHPICIEIKEKPDEFLGEDKLVHEVLCSSPRHWEDVRSQSDLRLAPF